MSILDRHTLEHDAMLDADAKRALFKRNVDLVELEPRAYCNRTCSFCPNATIDRLTVKTHLDHGLYETVLDDLASISTMTRSCASPATRNRWPTSTPTR